MFLGLRYVGSGGQIKQYTVRQHEEVSFGSSKLADYCVESEKGLRDVHFVVAFRDGGWLVDAVRGNSIQHNGHHVRSCIVAHGDNLKAGDASFEVTFPPSAEGQKSVAPASTAPVAEVPEEPRLAIENRPGLYMSKAEVVAMTDAQVLLDSLVKGRNAYLLFNRKKLADPSVSKRIPAAEDLIQHAPPEIRGSDSLEAIVWENTPEQVAMLVEILAKDAGILALSPLKMEEWLSAMKLVWGWFLRPSILCHHLENGSEFLLKQLLQSSDVLVCVPRGSMHWSIWGLPDRQAAVLQTIRGSVKGAEISGVD